MTNLELSHNIARLHDEIAIQERLYKHNQQLMFKLCSHIWEYNTNCDIHEPVKFKCIKCNLWKMSSMYR
jgi:hypothetical protein